MGKLGQGNISNFLQVLELFMNKSTACSTNARLLGAIILLKNFKLKRGITLKI